MPRHAIAPYELTPARYDMLYAIRKHARSGFNQAHLRRLLGVTSATVSRMATSLEELGFLEREQCPFDRRQLLVRLTPKGKQALEIVEYDVVDYGMIDFGVTCAFAVKWYSESAISALYDFDDTFRYVRGQLGDTATFSYPFHPDD